MPRRKIPLVTNEIYHVVNRSIGSIPIFQNQYGYRRFLNTMFYYQNTNASIKFSDLINLSNAQKHKTIEQLKAKKDFWVEIISYCLMPNHYHFLLKQLRENGIYNFIRLLSNSYSHFFNIKYNRKGSLFEGRFKAIRIETNEQLLHVSRYIHLNPYSSFVVKDFKSLLIYTLSSLPEYLNKTKANICNKEIILNHFSEIEDYKKFILNQADYQRSLEQIKHQLLE